MTLLVPFENTFGNVPVNQQPQDLQELKQATVNACINLNREFVRRSFDRILSRARRCIASGGNSFPNE